MKRRILSAVLILCVFSTVLSTSVLAADTSITKVEITFTKHQAGDPVSKAVATVSVSPEVEVSNTGVWYYYKGGYDAFLTQSGEWILIEDSNHIFQDNGLYKYHMVLEAPAGYVFPYDNSKSMGGYKGNVTVDGGVGSVDMTQNTSQSDGVRNHLFVDYISVMMGSDESVPSSSSSEADVTLKLVGEIKLSMYEPKIGDTFLDCIRNTTVSAMQGTDGSGLAKYEGSLEDYMNNMGKWKYIGDPNTVLDAGIYKQSVTIFMENEYVKSGFQYPIGYEDAVGSWVKVNGRDYTKFTSRTRAGMQAPLPDGTIAESRADVCNSVTVDYIFMLDDSGFHALMELPKTVIENPFTDVADDSYYLDAVLWALTAGVTTGLTETTFGPDATCTRAQAVTFLWRAMGSPEPASTANPFTDVAASDYFYKPVLWAVEQGITNGTSATTFSPNDTVTRGHTITFLHRAMGKPEAEGNMSFSDVAADAYYYAPVLWASNNGVAPTSGNRFYPTSDCPRAQIVYFIYNALNQ